MLSVEVPDTQILIARLIDTVMLKTTWISRCCVWFLAKNCVAPRQLRIFFQMRWQNLPKMESTYQIKTRGNLLIEFWKGSGHTISLTFCLTTKKTENKNILPCERKSPSLSPAFWEHNLNFALNCLLTNEIVITNWISLETQTAPAASSLLFSQ